VEVIGAAIYDVASKRTMLQVETTVNWPYEIDADELAGYFAPSIALPTGGEVIVSVTPGTDENECDKEVDTTCSQVWDVVLDTNSGGEPVCELAGVITFVTGESLCRDIGSPSSPAQACGMTSSDSSSDDWMATLNFTVTLKHSSLCEIAPTDASVDLHYDVEIFDDAEHTLIQSIFAVGSKLYFQLDVSDSSTIDSVTVVGVRLYTGDGTGGAGSEEDKLYEIVSEIETYPSDTKDAHFNISEPIMGEELASIPHHTLPNLKWAVFGEFKLSRKMNTLNDIMSPDALASLPLTLEITFDLGYHGNINTKRSMTSSLIGQHAKQHQLSVYTQDGDDDVIMDNNVVDDDELLKDDMVWWGESSVGTSLSMSMHMVMSVIVGVIIALMAN